MSVWKRYIRLISYILFQVIYTAKSQTQIIGLKTHTQTGTAIGIYTFNSLVKELSWLSVLFCFYIYLDAKDSPLNLIKCPELIDLNVRLSEADQSLAGKSNTAELCHWGHHSLPHGHLGSVLGETKSQPVATT